MALCSLTDTSFTTSLYDISFEQLQGPQSLELIYHTQYILPGTVVLLVASGFIYRQKHNYFFKENTAKY